MSEEGFLRQEPGFATKAIHVGQEPERWSSSAVVPPITLSTTFKQEAPAKHKVGSHQETHVCILDHNYSTKGL
jgi:cystathionine beta-lyase/cystathionine gamma-synthase